MKILKSESVVHPEGWFRFKITGCEEATSSFGPRFKWACQSSEMDEDGQPIKMSYFTSQKLSSNEKCKLTELFIACCVYDDFSDAEDETDTDVLTGKFFDGRVDEKVTDKGTFYNIGAVRRPKAKLNKKADGDPFEEQ